MKLTRRSFLATASASLALPAIARAETRTLKLSHYLPPQHQMHVELVRWADELRKTTSGALDIQVFPAGQMGPPPRQYDLARTGVADLAYHYVALSPGRFPLTDTFSLPFLFSKGSGGPMSGADCSFIATSVRDSLAPEFVGTELLYGIVITPAGFFMKDKRIETPNDLKGLRMRPTSAVVATHLQAWGASPATVSPTELADAIAKGVVDGAVFNFEGGVAFQLQQSVRKVSLLGSASNCFALVMSSAAMEKLPQELRQAIAQSTGPEAARRVGKLYDEAEEAGRRAMKEAGVEITEIRGDAVLPFRKALEPVAAQQVAALVRDKKDPSALLARIEALKTAV